MYCIEFYSIIPTNIAKNVLKIYYFKKYLGKIHEEFCENYLGR